MIHALRFVAPMAAALMAVPASATLSANALVDLDSVKWSITDTDLNDGVAAGLLVLDAGTWTNACIGREGNGNCRPGDAGGEVFNVFADAQAGLNTPAGSAAYFRFAHGSASASRDFLYADISGTSPSGQRATNANVIADVLFSGSGHFDVWADYTLGASANGESWDVWAGSWAGILAHGAPTGSIQDGATVGRSFSGTETGSGTLHLGFDFVNGDWRRLQIQAHTELTKVAVAEPSIPSVPEPSSYAMLLAGLGMIGLVVSRRRG